MASTKKVRSYRWSALRRRGRRITQAVGSALRPQLEMVEGRVLLSAYAMNDVATFGINGSGAVPNSTLAVDQNGNFYGTTAQGGAFGLGTVFEIASGSQKATAVASFNGSNGSDPNRVVVDASGNLYGTTPAGGSANDGTVFEIAAGSQAITTLASFNGTNGRSPNAAMVLDASGNLFGATAAGGSSNDGTLFEVAAASTTITVLASFSASTGWAANGLTFDGSGDLLGTAGSGGANMVGTVFELPKGSTLLTALASFSSSTNGSRPVGGVAVDAAGSLYGVTVFGGTAGTVFELASGTNALTTLASFNGTNGKNPDAVTLDAAGNLFGTTENGGATYSSSNAGGGTVFEVAKGSNAITTLTSFASAATPIAGLALGPDGNFYGTTQGGGAGGTGTMFEVADSSGAVTTLVSLDQNDGITPYSPLTMDAAGNLYGTTEHGGAFNEGTVYEIADGSSTVTVLAAFNGANGAQPTDGVTLDPAGDIFGAAEYGGSTGSGTVFELARGTGVITALASFPSSSNPTGGVTLDAAGDLFGGTRSGTVYEIPAGANVLTTYASFTGVSGRYDGGITFDGAGDMFGISEFGGTTGQGSIFEIPNGSKTITTLASFNGTNGKNPGSKIVVDADGNVYGAALGGGSGGGTVFELPHASNTITALGSFAGYGSEPSGVVRDAFGNLYGTLETGGASGDGTVFEMSKGSSGVTILATFNGANGNQPLSGVVVDATGNLYGTTADGGPDNDGILFKLTGNTTVTLAATSGSNPSGAGEPLTFTATVSGGGSIPDWETVLLVDASNDDQVVAGGLLQGGTASLTIPAGTLSPGTHDLVAAYRGDANYAAGQSPAYVETIQAPPPSLVGAPVINGDNPNGLYNAAGQTSPGQQRSMVEDIVYTFNEPVTISNANAAFTLAVAGPAGGTLPTTLYAQAVAGSNGTQWAVSLTGQPVGTVASIANGEYSITINPASVFAAADRVTSMAAGTGRTDTFYRLYGDVLGTENVTALDYSRFKSSLTTYNPIFDNYNTGNISALDYALFKKDLSVSYADDGFVTTI